MGEVCELCVFDHEIIKSKSAAGRFFGFFFADSKKKLGKALVKPGAPKKLFKRQGILLLHRL